MKIQDGPVIPGVSIGNFKLGMEEEKLLEMLGEDYTTRKREYDVIYSVENAGFWVAEDGKVDQIGVKGDFKGKYREVIGIGSTLSDVKRLVGNYKYVYSTYEMEEDKGICFELEDIEDWDELKAPIEYIFVFRIDT